MEKQERQHLTQVAAIPVRRLGDGTWQVMLVTSRESQRWVVPKGWPWVNLPDHEAAAEEAWEEAGIRGVVHDTPLGTFAYEKRRADKVLVPVTVVAYLLVVQEEENDWPERHERRRAWFSPDDAAAAVAESDLKSILRGLAKA